MVKKKRSSFLVPRSSRSGFTLIEILIVVSITVFLSAQIITYSRSGERQIALYVEKQKIAGIILKAKSLAVEAYSTGAGQTICGYGVEIDYQRGEYGIFSYDPAPPAGSADCSGISNLIQNRITTFSDLFKINPALTFPPPGSLPADAIKYVLFISPDPTVVINVGQGGSPSLQAGKIYLQTKNGAAKTSITVSPAGQVDF